MKCLCQLHLYREKCLNLRGNQYKKPATNPPEMLNNNNKKTNRSLNPTELMKAVFGDRSRTNLLKKYEQQAITWLVQRIPPVVTSNAMTGIGFFGSIVVA